MAACTVVISQQMFEGAVDISMITGDLTNDTRIVGTVVFMAEIALFLDCSKRVWYLTNICLL